MVTLCVKASNLPKSASVMMVPTVTLRRPELNLDAVMAQLTTPSNTDLSLRELVYENAAQLYTGAQDLETTVANILQRTDLYYAEQQ